VGRLLILCRLIPRRLPIPGRLLILGRLLIPRRLLIRAGPRVGHPNRNDSEREPLHDVHERLAAVDVDRLRCFDKVAATGLH
jgi:hypothetical protein